jgi:hypothetical protein
MPKVLVRDRKVVRRNRKIVLGLCPECCGGGGACCGTPIPGTAVVHKCTWPAGLPIDIRATVTGTYFYEDIDVGGNSGQAPVVRNQTINLNLVYLSPPAVTPLNLCQFNTNTVTSGTIGNADRKELSIGWSQGLILFQTTAPIPTSSRNYGNVPASVTSPTTIQSVGLVRIQFPAAGVFYNVGLAKQNDSMAGSPLWAATVGMGTPQANTVYTHAAPSVSPGHSSAGCLVGGSGAFPANGWVRNVPILGGGFRRTTVSIAASWTLTTNQTGCGGSGGGGGDSGPEGPDLSDVHDAMMRGAYGKPCQGCG